MLLILGAADDLAGGLRMSLAGVPASGLSVVYDQEAFVLEGEKEHFGFRDGISQVGVRGRLSDLPLHFLTRRYIDPADPRALSHGKPGGLEGDRATARAGRVVPQAPAGPRCRARGRDGLSGSAALHLALLWAVRALRYCRRPPRRVVGRPPRRKCGAARRGVPARSPVGQSWTGAWA